LSSRAEFRMQVFDPDQIAVSAGHYIGGRLVDDRARLTVHRPSDARPHAELPIADAAIVDAAVRRCWSALADERLGAGARRASAPG
jgi:aldehyde dehydrogenase (NAD+)